jgi:unsaturated rhamnogalacturonyl hydrolase
VSDALLQSCFRRISEVNRRLLLGSRPGLLARWRGAESGLRVNPADGSWKTALSAMGAAYGHQLTGAQDDLVAPDRYFKRQLAPPGRWPGAVSRVEDAMKGYSLLYLADATGEPRYRRVVDELAAALVERHPRAADGSLPYQPHAREILVDSLAMICPFLAAYARRYGRDDALELAVHQLKQFVLHSVDTDTWLPYHGYYADGPKRLGLHGWGRGTGWYMMGLVDTLVETPEGHADRGLLVEAFVAAAETLARHQRPDGHWHWVVLHAADTPDSSATALIGYSLARGLRAGLLPERYQAVLDAAISALVAVTRADGVVDGSLGECQGLGKYPQQYGPRPWLQGTATSLAALRLLMADGR